MNDIKIVQLYTPGLDSFIANWKLKKLWNNKHKRVYFSICGMYSGQEINFMQDVQNERLLGPKKTVKVIDINQLRKVEREDAYVPDRNLLFVTFASSLFDPDVIYINGVKDDRVSDNNKELFDNYSRILSSSHGKDIVIESLFWEKEKAQLVKEYAEDPETNSEDLLYFTYSCFSKEYIEQKYNNNTFFGCLSCPACFRKMCALTEANIFIPFKNKEIIKKYKEESSINELLHPYRYNSVKRYINFLENGD